MSERLGGVTGGLGLHPHVGLQWELPNFYRRDVRGDTFFTGGRSWDQILSSINLRLKFSLFSRSLFYHELQKQSKPHRE